MRLVRPAANVVKVVARQHCSAFGTWTAARALSDRHQLVDRVPGQVTVDDCRHRQLIQRDRTLVVVQECDVGGITSGGDAHQGLSRRQQGPVDHPPLPVDKRLGLLRELLVEKVTPVTATLLEQTVRNPRSRKLDVAAEELSELAAARRDRYVAHVRTPVRMTGEQEQRLSDTLTRLYGRPISLHVELDPDLLGGLVVRVGGELIDGSVAGRLAAARRTLPS